MQQPQQRHPHRRQRLHPRIAAFLASRRLNTSVRRHFSEVPVGEYSHPASVTLLAATYNVNGKAPPPGLDLAPWLAGAAKADLVVVGFQEIVPLNASNVVMGGSGNGDAARPWVRLVEAAINPKTTPSRPSSSPGSGGAQQQQQHAGQQGEEEFTLIAARQMVGVFVAVWARRRLLPALGGVQDTQVPTGILGMFGNKGAVAVRMRVHDTGLVAVVSHLSSGEKPADEAKRNADYWEVLRRGAFSTDDFAAGSEAQARRLRSAWGGQPSTLLEHDHAVWVGDLNYRMALPDSKVRSLLSAGDLSSLLRHEQLNLARARGDAFEGWQEGPIRFPPTFKFKRGTDSYLGDYHPHPTASASSSAAASSAMGSTPANSVASGIDHLSLSAAGVAGAVAGGKRGGDGGGAPALPGSNGVTAAALIAALDASQRGVTGAVAAPGGGGGSQLQGSCSAQGGGSLAQGQAQGQPEKVRTPAWCDRILYRTHPDYAASYDVSGGEGGDGSGAAGGAGAMRLLGYESAALRASDHKPVWALLEVPVLRFDEHAMEEVLAKAVHASDLAEMASMPKCCLEPPVLDLGLLRYGRPCTASLTVRNVGGVDARVAFVPQPRAAFNEPGGGEAVSPSWATPAVDEMDVPGGGAAQLHIATLVAGGRCDYDPTEAGVGVGAGGGGWSGGGGGGGGVAGVMSSPAAVDGGSAARLVAGGCRLDAILVLRVEDGNDMFLSLTGTYCPSFFGLPPDALLPLPRPLAPPPGVSLKEDAAQQEKEKEEPPLIDLRSESEAALDTGAANSAEGGLEGSNATAAAAARAGELGVSPRQDSWSALAPGAGGLTAGEVERLVPLELRQLSSYLAAAPGRLATPGLFVASTAALGDEAAGAAVDSLRLALDEGRGVPTGTDPHAAAATLLAYFASTPRPLLPRSVAAFADASERTPDAASAAVLLRASMPPAAHATLWHCVGLLRDALTPEAAAANGLTPRSVAALLAELWFEELPAAPALTSTAAGLPLPLRRSSSNGGGSQRRAAAAEQQQLAVGTAALAETALRRAEFLAALLEGHNPAERSSA